jgi:hypothetical protein
LLAFIAGVVPSARVSGLRVAAPSYGPARPRAKRGPARFSARHRPRVIAPRSPVARRWPRAHSRRVSSPGDAPRSPARLAGSLGPPPAAKRDDDVTPSPPYRSRCRRARAKHGLLPASRRANARTPPGRSVYHPRSPRTETMAPRVSSGDLFSTRVSWREERRDPSDFEGGWWRRRHGPSERPKPFRPTGTGDLISAPLILCLTNLFPPSRSRGVARKRASKPRQHLFALAVDRVAGKRATT